MSTDTKLGMVIGVVIVIAAAVTYYPKGAAPQTGRAGSVMPSLPSFSSTATNDHTPQEPTQRTGR